MIFLVLVVISISLKCSHSLTIEQHGSNKDFNTIFWNEEGRRKAIQKLATAPIVSAIVNLEQVDALTPEEASRDYDTYASSYDRLDGGRASSALGLDQARYNLFQQARGRVLEIGVGTGLNLDKYDGAKVSSLTLVDISEGMLRAASARAETLLELNLKGVKLEYVRADATSELKDRFGSSSFDTVVDSFSLCVMGNEGAKRCLRQIGEVVKNAESDGQVLLLENSRSSNTLLAMYQDATAEIAASAGGKGCVYNQDVGLLIRQAGLYINQEEEIPLTAGLFRAYRCVKP